MLVVFCFFVWLDDGVPDMCFGTAGTAVANLGGLGFANDVIQDAAGGLVVVGSLSNGSDHDGFAVRFFADGTRDMSFGQSGIVLFDGGEGDDYFFGCTQVSGNKLLLVGSDIVPAARRILLMRVDASGQPDPTFGTNGVVTHLLSGLSNSGYEAGELLDGRFYVTGFFSSTHFVARFMPDGSLDTSFNSGSGFNSHQWGDVDYPAGGRLQDDGSIVVCGFASISGTHYVTSSRFLSSGPLDPTYGTAGATQHNWTIDDRTKSMAIDEQGRIVSAGYSYYGGYHVALSRYDADGALEMGFGTAGRAHTTLGTGMFGDDLQIQADGKLIVTGMATTATVYHASVLRFLANGAVDSTFASGGLMLDSPNFYSMTVAVTLQNDGRVVLATFADRTTHFELTLVRLDNTSLTLFQLMDSWAVNLTILDLVAPFVCP
ncbi:MAG: hypothetical protein KDC35_12185 [Acidobacteria bacterium]|nr:hypothetical protein [Acidobacteriota bacterium]